MARETPSTSAGALSADGLGRGPSLSSTEALLTSTDSVIEAELIRGRLEAAGISARLGDAHTAGLGSHLTAIIGGVRVIVAREDVEAAIAVLEVEPFGDFDEEALAARVDGGDGPGAIDSAARSAARNAAKTAMKNASTTAVDDGDDDGPVSSADVAARWALWSAGLSLLVPIGGQIGSLFMMWRAVDLGTPLSEKGRMQLRQAAFVDVTTAIAWWAFLA